MGKNKEESLLTKRSFELSLSPPRAPPYGTIHWSVQRRSNLNSQDDPYADYHDNQAHSDYNRHSGVRERLIHLVYNANIIGGMSHPHLPVGPELSDKLTRYLGTVLPIRLLNRGRDSGFFRKISDGIVTGSIPIAALGNPTAAREFLRLSRQLHVIRYGEHESQFIDVLFPEGVNQDDLQGIVLFCHGGAWGSGKPWFYRLTARPFLAMKLAVAIIGYRTYPDGNVDVQVKDLETAYDKLSIEYPSLCGPNRTPRSIGLVVMGHSSGAHIALLMVVDQIKRLILLEESKTMIRKEKKHLIQQSTLPYVDRFVGISGPYNISDHFDYEAARGVEELSPMKAACGYSREQFRWNSPALRLQDFLVSIKESGKPDAFFPLTLLIHGIEDSTVPFTATGVAARALRSCGISKCHEVYVPSTGHQEAVMHLMLGGRACEDIIEWLVKAEVEKPPISKL